MIPVHGTDVTFAGRKNAIPDCRQPMGYFANFMRKIAR